MLVDSIWYINIRILRTWAFQPERETLFLCGLLGSYQQQGFVRSRLSWQHPKVGCLCSSAGFVHGSHVRALALFYGDEVANQSPMDPPKRAPIWCIISGIWCFKNLHHRSIRVQNWGFHFLDPPRLWLISESLPTRSCPVEASIIGNILVPHGGFQESGVLETDPCNGNPGRRRPKPDPQVKETTAIFLI